MGYLPDELSKYFLIQNTIFHAFLLPNTTWTCYAHNLLFWPTVSRHTKTFLPPNRPQKSSLHPHQLDLPLCCSLLLRKQVACWLNPERPDCPVGPQRHSTGGLACPVCSHKRYTLCLYTHPKETCYQQSHHCQIPQEQKKRRILCCYKKKMQLKPPEGGVRHVPLLYRK